MTYSIKAAAKRTGLSLHVIRMWERRYDAVKPNRTDTNRRNYSESDVNRLALLRAATQAGHSIGQIAQLNDEELSKLSKGLFVTPRVKPTKAEALMTATGFIRHALDAIQALDSFAFNEILEKAAVAFGIQGLLQKVIVPLTHQTGDLWQEGELTAGQEHFASSLIRIFVSSHARPYSVDSNASLMVIGTPVGQLHELGAVIAGTAATSLGWRVVNLGTGLPAIEFAAIAARCSAKVVALSIVHPDDDAQLPTELNMLRHLLPPETHILVGGRAAGAYRSTLEKIGATICTSLDDLYQKLEEIRASGV